MTDRDLNASPTGTPRLLAVSHSAVVAGYQERFSQVAAQAGAELSLLVPERWMQYNRWIELEKRSDPLYRIVSRQPVCWGLKSHRLRNVTHIYRGMGKLLDEVRPDIVELWEEPFSAVCAHTVRLARRRLPDAKVVFFSAQNIRKKYPPPFSFFERYVYRHADFAFVMNEAAGEIIREKGYRKGSLVLPLGVDSARFRKRDASALRRELGLSAYTVGFVGKFEIQKGVLDLIRACSSIKGRINLLLLGRGPLLEQMIRLARDLGREGDVKIVEPVSHEELPLYLNCMDVLVLPSVTLPNLKEQFGRVLIEAMACEVPVIGSDSGEIPAVVGEAGLVFPEADAGSLASLLRGLMEEPDRARALARKGRERVESNFTWSAIARKQIAVYHQLLGRKPERSA